MISTIFFFYLDLLLPASMFFIFFRSYYTRIKGLNSEIDDFLVIMLPIDLCLLYPINIFLDSTFSLFFLSVNGYSYGRNSFTSSFYSIIKVDFKGWCLVCTWRSPNKHDVSGRSGKDVTICYGFWLINLLICSGFY